MSCAGGRPFLLATLLAQVVLLDADSESVNLGPGHSDAEPRESD